MTDYAWHDKGNGRQVYRPVYHEPRSRSDLPCPMLIRDTMDAAEHVDGKFYTSKSEFRRVTKANGLIEVGNDPGRFKKPKAPDRDKAIGESIDRAIARL